MCRPLLRLSRGRRVLELAQHVVSEVDRVGQALEAEAVLGEAGHRQRARDGTERHHELLVADPVRSKLALSGHELLRLVEGGGTGEQELGVRAHDAERHHDVPWLEGSRGRLRAGSGCRA